LEVQYKKSVLKTLPITFIILLLQGSIKPDHKGTDQKMILEVKEEGAQKWVNLKIIIYPGKT
jgi:hypothetical protein